MEDEEYKDIEIKWYYFDTAIYGAHFYCILEVDARFAPSGSEALPYAVYQHAFEYAARR